MPPEGQESTVLIGPKTEEQLAAELAQAAANEKNQEIERTLEGALDRADKITQEELTGKDLDFDVKTFIAYGAIRKDNIKIMDKVFADMQSLSQKDKLVAEQLVKARFGNLSANDNVYSTAMESAILSMSILRINNKLYPMPTLEMMTKDPKAYAEKFTKKLDLYDMLLDANEKLVSLLSMLYGNLEVADALKEYKEGVDVAKKSEAPSSQNDSGSSAGS